MWTSKTTITIAAASLFLTGCDRADAGEEGTQNATDGADGGESGESGVASGCADPADVSAREGLREDIEGDTVLGCDKVWVLESTIFVRNGTLTIDPGTTILGTAGSALVVDQSATLVAEGNADAPIVMTSVLPEAERNRGDWGGLVLIGDAPVNIEGGVGQAEGFANPPSYGGSDAAHDCGRIRYVRVEWAGYEISAGNELNGVTFYACGTQTQVDHLQVHMGQDDGIEMFGGEFDASHLVVTGAADDSVDMDQGYRGRLQYVYIAQDPSVGDNAFEWSNQGTNFTATPRTHPKIANVTVIGSGASGEKSKGFTLKEGTGGEVYNSIFTDITNEAVLLTHEETQAAVQSGDVVFSGNVFHAHGGFTVDEGAGWTSEDLQAWLEASNNQDGVDPLLGDRAWPGTDPAPAAASPAASGAVDPADDWFEATSYVGAVDPVGDDWTDAPWIARPR